MRTTKILIGVLLGLCWFASDTFSFTCTDAAGGDPQTIRAGLLAAGSDDPFGCAAGACDLFYRVYTDQESECINAERPFGLTGQPSPFPTIGGGTLDGYLSEPTIVGNWPGDLGLLNVAGEGPAKNFYWAWEHVENPGTSDCRGYYALQSDGVFFGESGDPRVTSCAATRTFPFSCAEPATNTTAACGNSQMFALDLVPIPQVVPGSISPQGSGFFSDPSAELTLSWPAACNFTQIDGAPPGPMGYRLEVFVERAGGPTLAQTDCDAGDEDMNGNGELDPWEDFNGNGALDTTMQYWQPIFDIAPIVPGDVPAPTCTTAGSPCLSDGDCPGICPTSGASCASDADCPGTCADGSACASDADCGTCGSVDASPCASDADCNGICFNPFFPSNVDCDLATCPSGPCPTCPFFAFGEVCLPDTCSPGTCTLDTCELDTCLLPPATDPIPIPGDIATTSVTVPIGAFTRTGAAFDTPADIQSATFRLRILYQDDRSQAIFGGKDGNKDPVISVPSGHGPTVTAEALAAFISNFAGKSLGRNAVQLDWRVGADVFTRFEIAKSWERQGPFMKVGEVRGEVGKLGYSFTDSQAHARGAARKGVIWYRLEAAGPGASDQAVISVPVRGKSER